MSKNKGDESKKMVGFFQVYTDDLFNLWVTRQSDEYLAQVDAYETWNHFKRLTETGKKDK